MYRHIREQQLEHQLEKDVRRFRQKLLETRPELGRSDLQSYIAEFTERRRLELMSLAPAE
ncbi:MAG TPA: hypothetical protein VHM01_00240 [Alphaproteobacteria bacterium]|jgi:hypothetical protein|nr:hypothetical protein [Alphaproteobacteria bacterium]